MELAWRAATLVALLLAVRRVRWGYVAFVTLALLSFAERAGFHLAPRGCELLVGVELALHSFRNHPHIVLFALFFLLSRIQLSGRRASLWAFGATLAMGALVELAEGASGEGHCRLRDLLPDAAGGMLGWLTFESARALRRLTLERKTS